MTMREADITAVLVARDEGPRIGVSFHSQSDAVDAARSAGLRVTQAVVVLSDATDATRLALSEVESRGAWVMREVDEVDPGAARNAAVEVAGGQYVAFLDGGASWSENWLVAAHAVVAGDPERTIAHPEIHWFYERGRELYFPPDQDDPAFDPAVLRFGNCWDAQVLTAASVLRAAPFPSLGERVEPGRLDWEWSRATVAARFRHRVVPGTINFRRRRPRTLR